MAILVTGGTGYIGSHTAVELLEAGYEVVIADNLCNSSRDVVQRITKITGKAPVFYEADMTDREAVERIFVKNNIEAVIHFAGLKAVGESVRVPLHYYQTNIISTLVLCDVMQEFGVKNFVFSSSATVYGESETVPLTENAVLCASNPYGRTKQMLEEMLRDLWMADSEWSVALLRYFNPVGAHPSGLIGEKPNDVPNNLTPYITQVAVGRLEKLSVYGADYQTPDGTGIRDYIHVVDLARGHIKALENLMVGSGVEAYNLGTGKGYSVLEVITAFEEVSGLKVPYVVTDRRPGDIAVSYADPSKAARELGWTASFTLSDMLTDAWRWEVMSSSVEHV
ncbi:UDP-glucose 4-epimerase GalE [Fictibacillus aquaticus]|uniref:UDP-glucose 4-epimerase n=1 Tax=Fictibacillus aquaticus TaxID=2021314 RepID=A0A235F9G3_9BACL|nr:UDP-glucose 4-epimerase GalE [Fictibacillus aquaticus]OYD57724.1 UDP-glucose 4-epimerase GalE [Fictibacillus aquaticus]